MGRGVGGGVGWGVGDGGGGGWIISSVCKELSRLRTGGRRGMMGKPLFNEET